MGGTRNRRTASIAASAVAVAAALASLAAASDSAQPPRAGQASRPSHHRSYTDPLARGRLPRGARLLYVGRAAPVHPVRPGFLGLSLEYPAVEAYAGRDPSAVNPVFLQLVRNLTPSQTPVLRIGGDSTDWTWWPARGMRRPGGVRYALTPGWLSVTRALASQLGARLILGLNLEAGNPRIPYVEASALLSGIPRANLEALEPGNEPELYGTWTYYRARDGRKVTGRPSSYSFGDFEGDFGSVRRRLPREPFAGPTTGSLDWMPYLRGFLGAEPHLALVTLHRYPLQRCYFPRSSPRYPTIAHLLSPAASRGLAALFSAYVRLAHAHGVPLRVDEINTIGCGRDRPVAGTFASALWALDTLLALARQGVDGVNVHTYPGATYELFAFSRSAGRWRARVMPEYYGLLAFALAVPPASQPLTLSGPDSRALSAWALRAPGGGTRVILINEGDRGQRIAVRLPAGGSTTATLLRLGAPRAGARDHIELAGQSFGSSTSTGRLAGPARVGRLRPTAGAFVVDVPPTSAAILIAR